MLTLAGAILLSVLRTIAPWSQAYTRGARVERDNEKSYSGCCYYMAARVQQRGQQSGHKPDIVAAKRCQNPTNG